jgi:energy-coupling factor transporter ATP-binding protein EcfA2
MMKLKKFQVTQFRSVHDSGWIETDDVTALIGTNESGKTNVLLPLWKLNPAKEGSIIPTADYPRKHYNTFRHQKPKPDFIKAVFEVDDVLAVQLAGLTGMAVDGVREVMVTRSFDGEYEIDFPNADPPRAIDRGRVAGILDEAERELAAMTAMKSEEVLKQQLSGTLKAAREALPTTGDLSNEVLDGILTALQGVKTDSAPKTSTIVPRYTRVFESIATLKEEVSRAHPRDVDAAVDLVKKKLPKFVYYSTYGNLDSEIYLPHVIANLTRADLGAREQAKARTLKVLFEFVRLQPQEILELGHDFKDPANPTRQPTTDEVAEIAEKKKQRSILLQSASTLLTTEFRAWWKQGQYRFRFEADGDHFRIWVSDDKRPEEIELEGRSTGLQWFLSFYLVFLVERADAHEGAILLLDEPGLSLHPLAQRDLSDFFQSLSKDNQLLYTCHSPFLIDADRLDRVRKVYVDANGTSKVTPDLGATGSDATHRGAAYAVHAALGLTVVESLLLGCTPVIVEGASDQHYLTAIKNLLIAAGRLKPGRELVFPPAGGAKGVKAVASILSGRDETLPVALLDGDAPGRAMAKQLRESLYTSQADLVLDASTFTGMAESEIEDLLPPKVVARELDRWQRDPSVQFETVIQAGQPIVPQIEAWAAKHGVTLKKPGWKVELAKRVKERLLADGPGAIEVALMERWEKVFGAFQPGITTSTSTGA